jgi:hypothetical protein
MMRFIIGIIFGIILMIFLNNYKNNSYRSINHEKIIKQLVRQQNRWLIASKQDKNLLIALLHGNYASGYLWALKDVFTDKQIMNAMNFSDEDFLKLKDKIISNQELVTKKISRLCPEFSKDLDIELAKLAGDI